MTCLIVFSSLTHAQRAAQILRKNGISTVLSKPPNALGRGSCAYGLALDPRFLPAARQLLGKTGLRVVGIYHKTAENSWKA